MTTNDLIALRVFAADYHSGQWSHGYRLLSLTYLALRRRGIERIDDMTWQHARSSTLYQYLARAYAEKV